MSELIKTAPTVEEAVRLAVEEMGVDRDRVSFEILEEPGGHFFFKKPAKVRVYTLDEAGVDDLDFKDILRDFGEEKSQKPAQKKEKAAPAPAEEKKAEEKPREKGPERAPQPENRREKKESPEKAPAEKSGERKKPQGENRRGYSGVRNSKAENIPRYVPANEEVATGEKVDAAMDFLKGIIDSFDIGPYTMRAVKRENGFTVKVDGGDLGPLIGRKGDTMEAISYLTGLAANRGSEEYEKVTVDIGGYRRKREKEIENIARRRARRALSSGKPYGLDPMTPYERRIVHSTVSTIEGVRSESKGEGDSRRVVIYPLNPRHYGDNRDRDRRQSGRGRSDRRDRPRPQVQKTRDEKLVDSADVSLYSKIDLD